MITATSNGWRIKLGLVLLGWLLAEPLLAVPSIIPDPQRHQAFLYNQWQPNRPNLLIFIDPRCPYCKKAIPKYADITDHNVYVFWAPVLGPPSRELVRDFFHCASPSSPEILSAVVGGSKAAQPSCAGPYNAELRALNDEIVANYRITYVPAYFRQGLEVSLANIYKPAPTTSKVVNGVAINWQRYADLRVTPEAEQRNTALIVSGEVNSSVLALIKELRPAYLFSQRSWNQLCQQSSPNSALDCNKAAGGNASRYYAELSMLLGLEDEPHSVRLISNRGTLSRLQ